MVACHQFSLRIKHHISVVLVTTIGGTLRVTGIAWLLVSNICYNVDRVVLGQAAESFLHWGVAKPDMYSLKKENKNEAYCLISSELYGLNLLCDIHENKF